MCLRAALRRPERVLALACVCALAAFVSLGCLVLRRAPLSSPPSGVAGSAALGRRASESFAASRGGALRAAVAPAEGDLQSALQVPGDPDDDPVEGFSEGGDDDGPVPSPPAVPDAVAKALESIEKRMSALDERLASSAGNAAAAGAGLPSAELAAQVAALAQQQQVAALSQQVASILSIIVAEKQGGLGGGGAVAASPPVPTPPPAPTTSAAPGLSMEDVKRSAESAARSAAQDEARQAAKRAAEHEVEELKKALNRIVSQSNDRYAQVLSQLPSPDPPPADDAVLGPGAPAEEGHGCRVPPCSRDLETCKLNQNCCVDLMFDMLSDFSDYLTAHNVTHWLVAGSLLGAVRDKDMIPYTADVDIMIPREGWETVMAINKERGKPRGYFFQQDPEEHHCGRLCASWRGLPVNKANFKKHFDWDTERFASDVPYYMDVYDEHMPFGDKLEHLIYPVSTVTIRNKTFPAPREAELWVEARYGAGWRVPDNEARELQNKYPTLDEAKSWSEGMLLLRKARTDAALGHRLLSRATVDHKSGNIEVKGGATSSVPTMKVQQLVLEGFKAAPLPKGDERANVSESLITNGSAVIFPPVEGEGEVMHYVFHWATERLKGWDLTLEKIGGEPFIKVSRCSGGDPFKTCSTFGKPLHVLLPRLSEVPRGATHLVVACSNEAGVGSGFVEAPLAGGGSGGGADARFSRLVQMGVLGGLSPESASLAACVDGRGPMLKRQGIDAVVELMLKKNPEDMKKAMALFAQWLSGIQDTLGACSDKNANGLKDNLASALAHFRAPEQFEYKPGQVLDIDGQTIFLGINSAIGNLRKDQPAGFGMAVGEFLKPFTTTTEKPAGQLNAAEDSSSTVSKPMTSKSASDSALKLDPESASEEASEPATESLVDEYRHDKSLDTLEDSSEDNSEGSEASSEGSSEDSSEDSQTEEPKAEEDM